MAGRGRGRSQVACPEIQAIFQKYTSNPMSRRLTMAESELMMETEFDLSPKRAVQLFDYLDTDKNGYFSMWEFQHFWNNVGDPDKAKKLVEKFDELDKDQDGVLNETESRDALKLMTTMDGEPLTEKEVEFFFKTSAGDDMKIELGKFIELNARLRVYKRPSKK